MNRWVAATALIWIVVLFVAPGAGAAQSTDTTIPVTQPVVSTVGPEFSVTGDGTASRSWSVTAGAFALVFIGVGGYLFSRMSKRSDPSPPTGPNTAQ